MGLIQRVPSTNNGNSYILEGMEDAAKEKRLHSTFPRFILPLVTLLALPPITKGSRFSSGRHARL